MYHEALRQYPSVSWKAPFPGLGSADQVSATAKQIQEYLNLTVGIERIVAVKALFDCIIHANPSTAFTLYLFSRVENSFLDTGPGIRVSHILRVCFSGTSGPTANVEAPLFEAYTGASLVHILEELLEGLEAIANEHGLRNSRSRVTESAERTIHLTPPVRH